MTIFRLTINGYRYYPRSLAHAFRTIDLMRNMEGTVQVTLTRLHVAWR